MSRELQLFLNIEEAAEIANDLMVIRSNLESALKSGMYGIAVQDGMIARIGRINTIIEKFREAQKA